MQARERSSNACGRIRPRVGTLLQAKSQRPISIDQISSLQRDGNPGFLQTSVAKLSLPSGISDCGCNCERVELLWQAMRILTGLCLLLVASACGGSPPPAAPPPAPPANELAQTPAPAAEPAPAESARAAAQDEPPAPADAKATDAKGGTYSVFALLKVKDSKAFAASLEGQRADLEKASVVAYVISQGQDQTDVVIAHIVGRSSEKLSAFVETEKAKPAGLFAKASELFVAQDDAYQVPSPWPEEKTFDMFLRFKVKDPEAWRAHFDQNGEVRAAAGVIGYGIHHSLSDQRMIVHYLAKSTDLLRQIASMPEVTRAMKAQGVEGKPKPFYATNIAAKSLTAK